MANGGAVPVCEVAVFFCFCFYLGFCCIVTTKPTATARKDKDKDIKQCTTKPKVTGRWRCCWHCHCAGVLQLCRCIATDEESRCMYDHEQASASGVICLCASAPF